MSDRYCEICGQKINTTNQIVSRKDQPDTLNYYYFKKHTPGSNLVKRLDIHFDFVTSDGDRVYFCRKCFQFMIKDMVSTHMLGANWLEQEDKGE